MAEKKSFEQVLRKLEETSEKLKSEDISLEDAIKCYEADINYNFNELLASANLAGEMVNIHKYTAELLFSICLTLSLEMPKIFPTSSWLFSLP